MDESEGEPPGWLQPIRDQLAQAVAAQLAPVTEAFQALAAQLVQQVADQLAQDITEQVALALNAGIVQLTAGVLQQARPPSVVASGGLEMPAIRIVAVGDVGTATETALVTVVENFRSDRSGTVDPYLYAAILLVLVALVMPAAQELLPSEVRDMLNGYYATIGLALAVIWRMNDNRKR